MVDRGTPPLEGEKRTYTPFPGAMRYLVYVPWLVPDLLAADIIVEYALGLGVSSKLTWLLVLATVLLSLPPVLIVWGMERFTSLTLGDSGITYQGVNIRLSGAYLFPFATELRILNVNWGDIIGVEWAKDTNGLIQLATRQGDIYFSVLLHPQTNAEIMRTILEKAPHLRPGSGVR